MENKEAELQEVEERIKHTKDRRMYERYQTIRLHLMGNTINQIATILGRTGKTIKTYIRSYQKYGLDGLVMKFSTGKPPRLTKEQQAPNEFSPQLAAGRIHYNHFTPSCDHFIIQNNNNSDYCGRNR